MGTFGGYKHVIFYASRSIGTLGADSNMAQGIATERNSNCIFILPTKCYGET